MPVVLLKTWLRLLFSACSGFLLYIRSATSDPGCTCTTNVRANIHNLAAVISQSDVASCSPSELNAQYMYWCSNVICVDMSQGLVCALCFLFVAFQATMTFCGERRIKTPIFLWHLQKAILKDSDRFVHWFYHCAIHLTIDDCRRHAVKSSCAASTDCVCVMTSPQPVDWFVASSVVV